MLQQLGQHIAAAKERARLCGERKRTVTDETLKADLVEMEKAWLDLADRFETLKALEDFLLDSAKHKGMVEDVTDTLTLALQASGLDTAKVVHRPRLLSDNGSSYIAGNLAEWAQGPGL